MIYLSTLGLGDLLELSFAPCKLFVNSHFQGMSMELDVFVGNTTIIDEEVYQLWLIGYSGVDIFWLRAVWLHGVDHKAIILHKLGIALG